MLRFGVTCTPLALSPHRHRVSAFRRHACWVAVSTRRGRDHKGRITLLPRPLGACAATPEKAVRAVLAYLSYATGVPCLQDAR